MRKNILAIVFTTAVLALSGYGQTDDTFVSKTGRFSVTVPVGFNDFVFLEGTDPGDPNRYLMKLPRGSCTMIYYDLSRREIAAGSQKLLKASRDESITSEQGVLDDQEDITVDGFPGISFNTHHLKDQTPIYGREVFVLANARMYNYMYFTLDRAELTKPDVQKFFKSFHVQN